MNNPKKVLTLLWVALTIPVLFVGAALSYQISKGQQPVATQVVEVTPIASVSATIAPTVSVVPTKAVLKSFVTPTVRGVK